MKSSVLKKMKGYIVVVALLMTVSIFVSKVNANDNVVTVYPTLETESAHNFGDTADDTCIWIHPEDEELSLIIGDDKHGGLYVWNLDGTERQYTEVESDMNNLDIRYNFTLGNRVIALIGVVNENNQCLSFYTVNPVTRQLKSLGDIPLYKRKPYGGAMYHSSKTDKFYFFVNWKDGTVQQWELNGESGYINGNMVREFNVGSQVEGCVADDELGAFYIGEEEVGLWRYGAEPKDGDKRTMVDSTDSSAGGHLTADVEGVTLYYCNDKEKGYLICSSQGNSTYQIYNRKNNEYIGTFSIEATDEIDKTTETDGCDVTNVDLGDLFPKGLFIAHDHSNDGTDYSNHKLVRWDDIADKLDLEVDDDYDPTEGENEGPDLKDIKDKKIHPGEKISFKIYAEDEEDNDIDYYALNLPDGATFDPVNQEFSWVPRYNQTGDYEIKFVVTDGYQVDDETVDIKVK
ncbi:3-phytase [Orenia metallireducens]|uniref:3-phytase n=1 Tax=Orenia metallireducens TaxID=1413210 RepID=A0A285H720_9FIRM|nr:phytase [Orenia metallireducens]PRX21123.1 3-phytase [Orenia metallireducens]SNY31539.1 3-phytase [Orenia metallireducens]